jgi:A/G-specific adenine glycosylase
VPILAELPENQVQENTGNYLVNVSSTGDYWYDLRILNEVGVPTPIKRILDELSNNVR